MDTLPIQKDPRFKKLFDHYLYQVDMFKATEKMKYGVILSAITAPFFTIAASMQMSIKAHENLYGQTKGQGIQNLKQLYQKVEEVKKIGTNEKSLVESKSDSNVKVYETKKQK